MQKWQYAPDVLVRRYGEIEMPGSLAASKEGTPSRETVLADVRSRIVAGQKVQMAPLDQSQGMFTYSSSWPTVIEGVTYYLVVINVEPPRSAQ